MTDLIALIFLIWLFVKYGWSAFWWCVGIIVLCAVIDVFKKKNGKHYVGRYTAAGEKAGMHTRIYHPHVIEDDEFECPECGRRFTEDEDECPYCGARFDGTETDDEEFYDEEDELDAWTRKTGCKKSLTNRPIIFWFGYTPAVKENTEGGGGRPDSSFAVSFLPDGLSV